MTEATDLMMAAPEAGRIRTQALSDWLAVGVAISLPWSTSVAAILIVLWLLMVLPALNVVIFARDIAASAAGGLPIALWLLAALGMLWANVDWPERFGGLGAFHKLLVLPLLLHRFRDSDKGREVLLGFLASCTVLLALSWTFALWPAIAWKTRTVGVPVKEYILQSGEFLLCGLGAACLAAEAWWARRKGIALALAALSVAFLANIAYVSLARTTLVVAPVLLIVIGWRCFSWRGMLLAAAVAAALAAIAWNSSFYLRDRVVTLEQEIDLYMEIGLDASAGKRLEFWRKSAQFVLSAPIIGHGTGSIRALFAEARETDYPAAAVVTNNPHNQIFAVALQLGLLGTALLVTMWLAHFLLFCTPGTIATIGMLIVTQNVVGSLFNSHIGDFGQGWIYVFGVGVAGGMVLRSTQRIVRFPALAVTPP
jgi:O-antigen ligase